jgi:hypothetical protein
MGLVKLLQELDFTWTWRQACGASICTAPVPSLGKDRDLELQENPPYARSLKAVGPST